MASTVSTRCCSSYKMLLAGLPSTTDCIFVYVLQYLIITPEDFGVTRYACSMVACCHLNPDLLSGINICCVIGKSLCRNNFLNILDAVGNKLYERRDLIISACFAGFRLRIICAISIIYHLRYIPDLAFSCMFSSMATGINTVLN